jgi:predicted TPR repeat methyltransferase
MKKSDAARLDAAYSASDPDANKSLYRNWAETYDQEFAAESAYQPAKLVARAYLDAGGDWPVLDVGCGTGLVAENLPRSAVVDGLDFSPEMLAVAARKKIYRSLFEADLNAELPFQDCGYAGFVSAGTFTIGHVGPKAIAPILRLVRSGGLCVLSGNVVHFGEAGFESFLDTLMRQGQISQPEISFHTIYANPAGAPDGHANDRGFLLALRRL